jgi:sphingomyelin phosphodiesterase acid-like 3
MKVKSFISCSIIFFVVGGFGSCVHPLHKGVPVSYDNPYFIFLSDLHLDNSSVTTHLGQDAGTALWNNCKIKIDSILNSPHPPAFVLYTGDMPAHYACSGDCILSGAVRTSHDDNLTTVLSDFRQLVSKNKIPFFYAPGNNDALTGNYHSFSNKNDSTPFTLIKQKALAFNVGNTSSGATYMISNEMLSSGYYSARIMKGLRIICLNTIIMGNTYRADDGISQTDAGDVEMKWLAAQLRDANKSGDKVYIAMHIPPGIDPYNFKRAKNNPSGKFIIGMWKTVPGEQPWQNYFLQLIEDYQTTVAGVFFGHTHYDELRLLYDSTGRQVTQVALGCPGISSQHLNNPAFKLVTFDGNNSKLPLDYTTYYSQPNARVWGNDSYSFSCIFGAASNVPIYETLKGMTPMVICSKIQSHYMTLSDSTVSYDISPGVFVKWVP